MAAPEFDSFRLVGGTALSLQRGHRESVDIDIFTDATYRSVDFSRIDTFLRSKFNYVDTNSTDNVGMGKPYFIGNSKDESVKLDVFYTTDPFIQEAILIDGIRMATIEEIIAMKIDVISRTGRKKDFWDIHELKDDYTLKRMLELHKECHEYTHDADLIKQKFTDFKKADGDLDPVCLRDKKWGFIKLDIIDFSWTDSREIMKKERLFIDLKADVPYRLRVKGGIDCFNTLLYFRWNQAVFFDKQIMLNLRNNAGETYSTPVHFDISGYNPFSLVSDLTDRLNDFTFYNLEFISKEDIRFEFWAEDQEGGFINF
ncbi:MAG: nucleotidyl transferase AbiEii/AbiGii toxin family protein [Bacteroidia bacterium]